MTTPFDRAQREYDSMEAPGYWEDEDLTDEEREALEDQVAADKWDRLNWYWQGE